MRLSFSRTASRQIKDNYLYIAHDNPRAAADVVDRILEVAEFVAGWPNAGHETVLMGIRAIPANPHPYVLYFRRTREGVRLLRVLHAARRRPGLREDGREYWAGAL